MTGYETIPNTVIENSQTFGLSEEEPLMLLPSKERQQLASSAHASLTNKFGYILLGVVVGCAVSLGPLHNSKSIIRDNGQGGYVRAPVDEPIRFGDENTEKTFVIHGKSFIDSLPFEDIFPSMLDPLSKNMLARSEHLRQAASAVMDISSAMTSSGEASIASSLSTTPKNKVPDVEYHIQPSSFSLLYDLGNSQNYYLSNYSMDYFLLNSGGFDAQINQAYCAVASVAGLLNSLKYGNHIHHAKNIMELSFDLPTDPKYKPYPYATQKDILIGDCVWNTVIEHGDGTGVGDHGGNVDGIFRPPYGLSLAQASNLLRCHAPDEWVVTAQEVDPSLVSLSQMRNDLKAALIDPDARVMINYDRKGVGQIGGGHFSPLASYNSSTDSFLIMDVAKYKYPPVWVGASTLYAALATVDSCGNYDFPKAQERLMDEPTGVFNPVSGEEYRKALEILGCEKRMRGYVILRKQPPTIDR